MLKLTASKLVKFYEIRQSVVPDCFRIFYLGSWYM